MGCALAFAALGAAWQASAQEALRSSLAGQASLDAKKRRISEGWGDVRLGPVKLDLQAQMGLEASDNVRYAEDDTQEDLIIRPGINVNALWPITEKNMLSFGAGIAYYKYINETDLDYLMITPGSDLSFDVYAGDFVINFHNRFHYSHDVASQAELAGRGDYGRFDNSLGTLVQWDLNKMILTFNYDHQIYLVTDDDYDYIDHTSELFSLRSAWLITPATPLGLEFGFGTTDYDQHQEAGSVVVDDLIHYSFGAFFEMPSGKNSSFRLGAGYVIYDTTTDANTNSGSMDAVYADLSFNHRLTQHIQYSLSVGNQLQAGLNAETVRILYARASVNWAILRGFSLGTSFGYENGEESGGWSYDEQFDRYTASVALSKRLNEKLSTSLRYSFMDRVSDVKGRDYAENRLVLDVSYAF